MPAGSILAFSLQLTSLTIQPWPHPTVCRHQHQDVSGQAASGKGPSSTHQQTDCLKTPEPTPPQHLASTARMLRVWTYPPGTPGPRSQRPCDPAPLTSGPAIAQGSAPGPPGPSSAHQFWGSLGDPSFSHPGPVLLPCKSTPTSGHPRLQLCQKLIPPSSRLRADLGSLVPQRPTPEPGSANLCTVGWQPPHKAGRATIRTESQSARLPTGVSPSLVKDTAADKRGTPRIHRSLWWPVWMALPGHTGPLLQKATSPMLGNITNLPNLWQASLVAQPVKNLPVTHVTRLQFLGREDPLEKEMATHFSILAWRIPRTEEPGNLQSMGSQRVRHDSATEPPPPPNTKKQNQEVRPNEVTEEYVLHFGTRENRRRTKGSGAKQSTQ